jgi:hypothetical protein
MAGNAVNTPMRGGRLMSRRIAIMIGGLFLIGMTVLPGVAQAAVAPSSTSAVAVQVPAALQAPGPDIGADAELTAVDGGIASAFLFLLGGSAFLILKGQRAQAAKIDSLSQALAEFHEATIAYRGTPADKTAAAEEVSALAVKVKAAASGCGQYGKRAVSAAQKIMRELKLPYPDSDPDPDTELAVLETELAVARRGTHRQPTEQS